MLTTHTVANGDIVTAYHDEGRGEALLLLHGFTGSKLDFHDQIPWFSDRYRVLAPDQRGHGESTNVGREDAYAMDILVGDLAGFLDALDVERVHLLGHSMGGMVAMRFALKHPTRLKSLILMDTAAEPLTIFPAAVREQLARDVRANGCAARIDMMKSMEMSEGARRGVDYLGEAEHWRRIELKLNQMDPEAWVGIGNDIAEAPAVLPQLHAIKATTTILCGDGDVPFVEPSARMAKAIPNARLVMIPLAAHCPQYENAEVWRKAIDGHLARAL
ncbi:MAG TPA: alpha/beta fold hydrolase [Pseudomonadales bacterium]|nr:alpha/beta fold hydrolase [Pseudomonadales bacterium]